VGLKRDYLIGFTGVRTFDLGGSNLLNLSLPYSAYTDVRCISDPGRTNIGYNSPAAAAGALNTGENPTGNQVCAWSVPKSYPTFSVVNNLYANYAQNEGTKNYTAFETTFQKQTSHGWSALFGYTVDFAHVNTADQRKFSPNSLVYNWEEPQWNQSVKMNGTYDLPWHGIKYSTAYQIQTGQYYGRFVNVTDANGSTKSVQVEQHAGRYPAVRLWDNRVAKVFKIGDRQTIEGMFDLYNTLNANTILQVITTNSNTFLEPLAANGSSTSATPILPARIFKLGVRYRF
jgi:hypothetical protein